MGKKYKIVIVEDEEVLLDVLKKKLVVEGYEVVTAMDGEKGLSTIRSEKPDLLLLDIMLPKMDGYQIMEAIKKDPKTKAIPVVVISNSGQPVEIKKLLDLGANDYLVKADFSPEEVMEKVKSILGQENGAIVTKSKTGSGSVGSSPRAKGGQVGKGTKVLLIEDDKFLSEICATKLNKEGFEVTLAIDGETGLKNAQQEIHDIILLDIRLPGMDGFQVLEKLKSSSNPEVKNVPVVIMSNFGQEDYISKAMSMGAVDYLVKASFTTDEIVNKITTILKK